MTNVDTSIHDRTTGRAASLAACHDQPSQSHPSFISPQSSRPLPPQSLTLYGSWFCPFVQRVWLVLHANAIPHQYIEINPYKKDKHFLQLNPRGLVPTLAIQATHTTENGSHDDAVQNGTGANGSSSAKETEKILYESSVILDYLDQVYTLSLYPPLPYDRAWNKLWIDHISTRIIPSFYRFLQHTPEKDSQYTLASAREEFVKHIYTFAEQLSKQGQGPFFNGSQMKMIDVILIPWACRIFLLDHYKGSSGIPKPDEAESDEAEEVWGRWRRWFAAVEESDSVQDTLSDRSRYIEVYQRYAEDTTGSQVGQATRGGKGLP